MHDEPVSNLHLGLQSSDNRDILRRLEGGRLLRRILILAVLLGLGACAHIPRPFAFLFHHHHSQPTALVAAPPPSPPPTPAQGLWAILDPGCPKPSLANINDWPKCASPFWISGGKAMVIRSDSAGPRYLRDASYIADFHLAPGDPLIAQVGTQKDGYLFLALTDLSKDDQGRLIGAIGAAVACPTAEMGALSAKPNLNGCASVPLDTVRRAAAETLEDRSGLTEVAWIASGVPRVQ